METLAHTRCYFHAEREAVARCPLCGHTYCRECITDHEGRVLCAGCLAVETGDRAGGRRGWGRWLKTSVAAGIGLLFAWFLFYLLAGLLLRIPSEFHEGRFWQ